MEKESLMIYHLIAMMTIISSQEIYSTSTSKPSRYIQLIRFDQLEKISKMIIEANGVHLYGKGQSLILCEDLQYKLFRIGIDTNLSSNTGFQVMKSGAQPQGSIAIMISYYGMGNENLFIAKCFMKTTSLSSLLQVQSQMIYAIMLLR